MLSNQTPAALQNQFSSGGLRPNGQVNIAVEHLQQSDNAKPAGPLLHVHGPELGRVGLDESKAWARRIANRVARMPMAAVLRTRTISEPRVFMKMLIDESSDRILGFTVFGPEASELMATVQTATLGNVPYTALRDALFTHPTAAEVLTLLLASMTSDR